MAEIVVVDTIRKVDATTSLREDTTVAAWIEQLVVEFGLPDQTLPTRSRTGRLRPGAPIDYTLRIPGHAEPLDPHSTLSLDDLGDDARVEIVSEDGLRVWDEIAGLASDVETTLGLEAKQFAQNMRDDAHDEVTVKLQDVRRHAEAEARSHLRQLFDTRLSMSGIRDQFQRWKGRRVAEGHLRRIASTGAAREAVTDARLGLTQVAGLATRTMRMVPVVAAVAGTAAGATAIHEVADDDLSADEIAEQVVEDVRKQIDDLEDQITDLDGEPQESGEPEELDLEPFVMDATTRAAIEEILNPKVQEIITAIETEEDTDLAARQTLGGFDGNSPSQPVSSGGSLWNIATAMRETVPPGCDEPPTGFVETTGAYVDRIWAANVGLIGSDPDAIEPETDLVVPCPR